MGNREKTIQSLDAAWADRVPDLPSMRWDPALDLELDDPRYKAIIEKIFGRPWRKPPRQEFSRSSTTTPVGARAPR
jgi:hypothetical protein